MVKKISHKEVRRRMKMNEMEEARHWLERLWERHSQKITWGLVALAILAVVFYLYLDARQKNRMQAQVLLGEALASTSQGNYEEAIPLVEQIVQQYTSSSIYPLALMLKGDILFAQNNVEEALLCYEQLADRKENRQQAAAALLSIAACHENLDRAAEAEATYRRLLREYPQAPEVEEARFRLAQLLDLRGETHEAVALYRQIPEASVWFSEAVERAGWLEASPITLSATAAAPEQITSSTPS